MDHYNEEPSNYEQKCLCVLVLDTSGSMSVPVVNPAISQLNAGLKSFQNELLKDEVTRDRLEVAIITFDSQVKLIQDPELLTAFTMPTLDTGTTTAMVDGISKAIDLVTDRKNYYKSHGIPYYRPWIVMMTDGEPDRDQDVDGMAERIKMAHKNKEFVFMAIGVGDNINERVLAKLSTPDFPPMKMQAVKFCEFFTWLSNSMSTISTSDGSPVQLENPSSWLDNMITQ